jgi:Ala-tRNA(Pro) deacylase
MSIAPRIEAHLSKMGIHYDLVQHPESSSSLGAIQSANIPSHQMAKAVMTHDGDTYRLCVIPADHKLVLPWLNDHMHGHYRLVDEADLKAMFDDCEMGAVPALGQVYGLPVICDQSLLQIKDIYFESGDHKNLIHVDHGAFMELMGLQETDVISYPSEGFESNAYLTH